MGTNTRYFILISSSELSSDTLAALQEFYSEKDAQEKRFENLKAEVDEKNSHGLLSMEMFSEDWNASQFWVRFERAFFHTHFF